MKILYMVFHPDISKSRTNKAIVDEATDSGLHPRDMYKIANNFEFDIQEEQKLLKEADRIVFQFPFYWYSCPPLMKKWLDDVLTYGFAYGPGVNTLKDKEFLIALTIGSPAAAYVAGGFGNFTVTELLRPFQQTANFLGMKYPTPVWVHNTNLLAEEDILENASLIIKYIKEPALSDPWNVQERSKYHPAFKK